MSNVFNYEFQYESSIWTGHFTSTPTQLLVFTAYKSDWWLGTFSGGRLNFTQVGNTSGFGNTSQLPTWTGNFTGTSTTEILLYYPGDGNWWLGTLSGTSLYTQLNWTLAGNTSGFGNISTDPIWVGNFTGTGKSEILFFSRGDKNWWLGTFNGTQLGWTLAGNTSGFGDTSRDPTWIADFTGAGRSEILFYSPGDGSWWLGTFNGTQLGWTLTGNTSGFGNLSGDPFWIGNYTVTGHGEVLFFSRGDKNWWLGTFNGTQLGWTLAGNTSGFGDTSTDPTWIADFTGSGKSEVLFFSTGDKNWWLGIFNGTQLGWTLAGNTSGFGDTSKLPTWIADFTGSGKSEVLFYYAGDGNWWLGTFSGTQLGWSVVDYTKYIPPTPPPPPPPPMVSVPYVINLLMSNAITILTQAQLQIGFVYNPTNIIYTNQLLVTAQSPSAGTKVPQGSYINLAVTASQQQKGVKQLSLYNCDTDNRAVYIWVYDENTGSWQEKGQLNAQYGPNNTCPVYGSTPLDVTFSSGHTYTVVAVDTGNSGCSGNNPTDVSCQRFSVVVVGDAQGQTVQYTIS